MPRRLAPLVLALVLVALPAGQAGAADRAAAERALEAVRDARSGSGPPGRALTPLLRRLARSYRALDGAARREAETLLARPTDGAGDPYGDGYSAGTTVSRHCTSRFCFHWVSAPASDADAPDLTDTDLDGVPDYVEAMAAIYDEVEECENGTGPAACGGALGLGWANAPSDGTLGGDARLDVYLKDLFPQGVYGYVAPDTGQPGDSSQFSFMVMDKDFARFAAAGQDALDPMRVTAAHEYNHVLQFGYDALEQDWMFEASATWAEEKVYPAIDDYLQYLPDWVANRGQPLTTFTTANRKVYGSAVWNHWLSARHGDAVTRQAWAQSATLAPPLDASFAPDAYTNAIAAVSPGSTFSTEFEAFAARTAEWRVASAGFPDLYPAVPRDGTASLTANVSRSLDHTTHALFDVTVPAGAPSKLRLTGTVPGGTRGAVALVGRDGTETAGMLTTGLVSLPSGGTGHAELADPAAYERITAVLVNSDDAATFNNGLQDWKFTNDNQALTGDLRASPSVTTGAASSVTTTGASVAGTVNPNAEATTWKVQYGTSTAYGSETTALSAGSGSAGQAVTANVMNLEPLTTYHYRVVATNAVGTTAGPDRTFTTARPLPQPPAVTTGAVTGVGEESATLTGVVDPGFAATTWHFEYGPTSLYGSSTAPQPAGDGGNPVPVSAPVSALEPGITYHYRLVATNSEGTVRGADVTFTTTATAAPAPPATEPGPQPPVAGEDPFAPLAAPSLMAPDTRAPGLTLAARARQRLRTAVRRGVAAAARIDEPGTLVAELMLDRRSARRLGVRTRLGRLTLSLAAPGTARLVLRPAGRARRALARARTLRLTLVVTATDAARNASVARRVISLR